MRKSDVMRKTVAYDKIFELASGVGTRDSGRFTVGNGNEEKRRCRN